jgi:hypothetical protein
MPLPPKRLPLRSALDAATPYDATGTKYAPDVRALARPSAMSTDDSKALVQFEEKTDRDGARNSVALVGALAVRLRCPSIDTHNSCRNSRA